MTEAITPVEFILCQDGTAIFSEVTVVDIDVYTCEKLFDLPSL